MKKLIKLSILVCCLFSTISPVVSQTFSSSPATINISDIQHLDSHYDYAGSITVTPNTLVEMTYTSYPGVPMGDFRYTNGNNNLVDLGYIIGARTFKTLSDASGNIYFSIRFTSTAVLQESVYCTISWVEGSTYNINENIYTKNNLIVDGELDVYGKSILNGGVDIYGRSRLNGGIDVYGGAVLNGNVGIGTNFPNRKLEIWDGNSARFTFSGTGCTSTGYEVAHLIDNAGYKMNIGSADKSYKVAVNGVDVFNILANSNFSIGAETFTGNLSGTSNTALGQRALKSNTTGSNNFAAGYGTLTVNTTGFGNTAIGVYSMFSNTTGAGNFAAGQGALSSNTTGYDNVAIGYYSLGKSNGDRNIGIGNSAGKTTSTGTDNVGSTSSIFLGGNTKAANSGETNQIVIGEGAIGNGSNSITLGNSSIFKTIINGKIGLGTTSPNQKLSIYDGAIAIRCSGATVSDEGYKGALMITKPATSGQYINLVRQGLMPWSIGTVYNTNNFAIGCGTMNDASFTNPFFTITNSGFVGVGTTSPDSLLTVKGGIHARAILIDYSGAVADYVFSPDYKLRPLHEVEQFVKANSHLPEIPSAMEVSQKGMNVAEMQNKLLQKVEELTLYVIEQQKMINRQQDELKQLKKELGK